MKQLLDEARKMIRMNSVVSSGNEELANHALCLMQERGMKAQMQQVFHSHETLTRRQFNAVGIFGDPLVDKKTRKGLLLCSHLDTVDPGLRQHWTICAQDPFHAVSLDGKIYGLGAADAKLDFLCKLHAIEKFREKKLKMPVYIAATCGDVIGKLGARYLIKSMVLNPQYVVVGAPSGLRPVIQHKQFAMFKISIGFQIVERDAKGFNRRIDLTTFGKMVHGAHPMNGVNAIERLLGFLKHTVESGFEVRFTKIKGGESDGVVPDQANAEFYLTSHQFEDFKRYFRESVREASLEDVFRVELGGLGESGVRFLPDAVFPCVSDVVNFFTNLAEGFQGQRQDQYVPAHSTVNFCKMQPKLGGVDLFFDVRMMPETSLEEVEKQILMGMQAIVSRYPQLNVFSQKERVTPCYTANTQGNLWKYVKEVLDANQFVSDPVFKSETTAASIFQQAGYETLLIGPGAKDSAGRIPDESILVEELDRGIHFYTKLIERVCL